MKLETADPTLSVAIEADVAFDPLEDLEPDTEDETDEFYGEFEAHDEACRTKLIKDTRSAKERIEELFGQMKFRKKILLGILDYCREPQPVALVNAHVEEMQKSDRSVFSSASLCAALEKAGALIKQTADGSVVNEETLKEPDVVEVDGVEYLEAKPAIEVFWKTTTEGLAVAEADKPLERMVAVFEEDAFYTPIFERILHLCSAEDGATVDALGEAVDKDPLVQEPRLFAPYFFEKLEQCDALRWEKTWRITEIGKQGLVALASDHTSAALTAGGE